MMKNKGRFLTLILAAALCVSALGGCHGSSEEETTYETTTEASTEASIPAVTVAPGTTEAQTTPAETTAAPVTGSGIIKYINAADVRARTAPAADDANIAMMLARGTAVEYLGDEGEWIHILYNGAEYYVAAQFVSDEEPVNVTANSGVKAVALTFDDGPDTTNTCATTRINDVMERYGAHCTFFVVSQAAVEWFPGSGPEQMRRAISLGCEVGTHTYEHANLNTMPDEQAIQEEVSKGVNVIEEITGVPVTLMRPPYGNANETVVNAVNYPLIQWDVDTLDWESKDADQVVARIQQQIQPGSIVLMHDIYSSTADAVERIVPWLQEQGYTLMTVTELFEAYGVPLEAHHQYYSVNEIT